MSKTTASPRKAPLRARLVEETEVLLDRSRWWAELGLESNRFERDDGPSDVPIAPFPLWLPETFDEFTIATTVRAGSDVVAMYHGNQGSLVVRFRDGKPTTVLSLARELRFATAADMAGDTAFIAGWDSDGKGRLLAVDTSSGALRWTASLPRQPESVLCFQNHVFVSAVESPRPAEIVAFDPDSGAVVARVPTPKNRGTYWLAPAGKGLVGLTERGHAKIALE